MGNFFTESNRDLHFFYAIPIGLLLTILCVIGLASGLEYKDKLYGNKWDWIDWIMTVLGGLVGQIIQLLIIYLII